MIFVTLGTQDKPFDRLLRKLDEMIEAGIVNDEIIVQAGCTKYKSKHMKIFDYIDMDTFNTYINDCDMMIAHGGVGTIINGINHGKPVMAVARRVKYGEHENDHQVEITSKFVKLNYIIGCLEVDEMTEKFPLLKDFKTKPYESNNAAFCEVIQKIIG